MTESMSHEMPRARQEKLLVHELADEVLVYDLKRHKAHCLNRTAALVWNRCDGQSSVTEIARLLEHEMGTSVDEDVVRLALNQLERVGLLGERPSQAMGTVRVRRRELMRRMGLAAAVSLPLVVSILSPTSAQAQSCGASGTLCTSHAQCCSGVCQGPNGCK
jgi:hypothetical protein